MIVAPVVAPDPWPSSHRKATVVGVRYACWTIRIPAWGLKYTFCQPIKEPKAVL